MNILVTGYPGWLGSRLVERLLKESRHKLRVLCLRNIPVRASSNLQIVRGDVRELYTLIEATRDIDLVIHAAGIIHARPKTLIEVNAQGTLNMLRACEHNNVDRMIYISSNSAAGYTEDKVLMTEGTLRKPYMAYGKSKFLAEEYVNGYCTDGKIRALTLRPCWYYFSNQPPRQTRLFKMIQSGRPIIFGDGLNIRSMTYIDNLVDAILLAIESPFTNRTYWIADERPYTINEIYETIADLLNVEDFNPIHIPKIASDLARVGDKALQKLGLYSTYLHVAGEMSLNIACSIERARRELGYEPRVSLREGMKRSIEWCRKKGLL